MCLWITVNIEMGNDFRLIETHVRYKGLLLVSAIFYKRQHLTK